MGASDGGDDTFKRNVLRGMLQGKDSHVSQCVLLVIGALTALGAMNECLIAKIADTIGCDRM